MKQTIVVARSLKSKIALANYGIKTDIVPDQNTADGIAKILKSSGIQGKKIGILWHGSAGYNTLVYVIYLRNVQ